VKERVSTGEKKEKKEELDRQLYRSVGAGGAGGGGGNLCHGKRKGRGKGEKKIRVSPFLSILDRPGGGGGREPKVATGRKKKGKKKGGNSQWILHCSPQRERSRGGLALARKGEEKKGEHFVFVFLIRLLEWMGGESDERKRYSEGVKKKERGGGIGTVDVDFCE